MSPSAIKHRRDLVREKEHRMVLEALACRPKDQWTKGEVTTEDKFLVALGREREAALIREAERIAEGNRYNREHLTGFDSAGARLDGRRTSLRKVVA